MSTSPITLEIVEGPEQTTDADGWEHYAYRVSLTRDDVTIEIPWMQGLGITDDPDPERVLDSMLMDAAGYLNSPSFEAWALEYGYDPDSRKHEAIFKAVDEQTEQLRDLLGEDFDEAIFPGIESETVARRLVRGLDIRTGLEVSDA